MRLTTGEDCLIIYYHGLNKTEKNICNNMGNRLYLSQNNALFIEAENW